MYYNLSNLSDYRIFQAEFLWDARPHSSIAGTFSINEQGGSFLQNIPVQVLIAP
jgi:hypothetical protein